MKKIIQKIKDFFKPKYLSFIWNDDIRYNQSPDKRKQSFKKILGEDFNKLEDKYTQKFSVPVNDWKEKSLKELIQEYEENVECDESDGTLKINGKFSIPFKKSYWLGTPANDTGKPTIEMMPEK